MNLKLEDLSYEWVEETQDLDVLQKGVKLIEEDGDFYIDLKKTILKKIQEKRGFSENRPFEKE